MRWILFRVAVISFTLSASVFSQNSPVTAQEKAVIDILSFKIGSNYNPLLDNESSVFSADTSDLPLTEAEKLARRNATSNRTNAVNVPASTRGMTAPEDKRDRRARGQLRSTIRMIDLAEWVNLSLKNNSDKAIQSVEWSFSFPRYEEGKLLLRYNVISKAEIKSGAKKSLKQKLPPNAKKCQFVNAEAAAMEMVCGQGFDDPSKIKEEIVSIKKITYADGSVWERH